MMKQLFKILLLFLISIPFAGIIISACSEEDICGSTRHMFICVPQRYYTGTDSLIRDTLPYLHITAVGTDSIILNQQINVREFELPLMYGDDITSLVFFYDTDSVLFDTIWIEHLNTPYFLSMECGFEIKQEIIDVDYTPYKLNSIEINKSTKSKDGTPNLYFIY